MAAGVVKKNSVYGKEGFSLSCRRQDGWANIFYKKVETWAEWKFSKLRLAIVQSDWSQVAIELNLRRSHQRRPFNVSLPKIFSHSRT